MKMEFRHDLFLLRIYFIFPSFRALGPSSGTKGKITNFHIAWKANINKTKNVGIHRMR